MTADLDQAVEEVQGQVVFDPESGWLNQGFVAYGEPVYFVGAIPRYRERDVMMASLRAIAVPNLDAR